MQNRCPWANGDPLYEAYHDDEWGIPCYDARMLFANLVLDGFQAGLSWLTILRKREGFHKAFDSFDPQRIARYGAADVERLLGDAGIVRNKAKVNAAIVNARAFLELEQRPGGFSALVWNHVGGKPLVNKHQTTGEVPAHAPEAQALSAALKQAGFKFVGPTIVYAFMQACGLVNDHLVSCPRYKACMKLARK
jgi:DNA-3-methyladenine glycosylase I